jgi:predicted AAA+ superfamily ATPase
MYKRDLSSHVQFLANKYPVLTILGPRQAGKTTLVKNIFKNLPYVNLEDLENRALALSDPKSFIAKFPNGAIFDEIQRVPSLLSCIQVKVDEDERKGLFILTGSHQLDLHSSISQSLAGRTSLMKLLPLSLLELRENGIDFSIDTIILQGGYPRLYKDQLPLDNAYSSYVQTYVERDVRSILNIKDIVAFEKFLKLLASRVGQIINYSSLSIDVGVSATTIKEWISVLEASYLIFRLEPYYENFGKRVIKSPKIYFYDTGLLCYLLGIKTIEELKNDNLYGNIFENFVVLEFIKYSLNKAQNQKFYFYRDVNGNEIDMMIQKGSFLIPIEIKSSKTFSTAFLDGLNTFHQQAASKAKSGFIVYQGSDSQQIKNYSLVPIETCTKIFDSLN